MLKTLLIAAFLAPFLSSAQAQDIGPSMSTEHARATLLSERAAVAPGQSFWVALKLELDDGWHTYWKNPGDSGLPGDIIWTLPAGVTAAAISWPIPERAPYMQLMNFGFHGTVLLPVKLTVAADAPATTGSIRADGNWLVCADICIPDQGVVELPLTIDPAASGATPEAAEIAAAVAALPKPAPWPVQIARSGPDWLLTIAGEVKNAEFFPDTGGLIENAPAQVLNSKGGVSTLRVKADPTLTETPASVSGLLVTNDGARVGYTFTAPVGAPVPAESAATADVGLLTALVFAFLGGLILNLMPCVLPVLAMKAVALARSGAARTEGIAYTLGCMATFGALALILLAVRGGGEQLGWGFQLQEPVFVAVMAAIVLLLGLMLSGVFTIGGSIMGVGQGLTSRNDAVGAFATGALAVVVATPCTAPFMGSAMAFALTQPFAASLLVFEALALGLAAPFLLISLVPAIGRWIPKPGAWMDTFKQVLAFPMYATAAWLVWVLTQQSGPDGVAAALAALILVALAAWAWGRMQQGGKPVALGATAAIAVLAAAAMLGQLATASSNAATAASAADLPHEAYSAERVQALRAEQRPVLVNFTAAWCITCLVNERVAFSNNDVIDALGKANVAYVKGDWTNRNKEIAQVLESYGRVGVPLYLYFAPGATEAKVLPQILTPSAVIDAVAGS